MPTWRKTNKTRSKQVENMLKTSSKQVQNMLKTSLKRTQSKLKTWSKQVYKVIHVSNKDYMVNDGKRKVYQRHEILKVWIVFMLWAAVFPTGDK